MNKAFIADFKHLHDEKELLGSSRFWSDFIKSRVKINQVYGEKLLSWSTDVRKKLDSFSEDASVGNQHVRHFLDTYLSSTEVEAYQMMSASCDITLNGGPIQSLAQMTSSNDLWSKHENLSRELDSIIKQHLGCAQTLQDMKEKGLKAIAASSNYEQRISDLKDELNKTPCEVSRSQKDLQKKIRDLETRLQKQTEKERSNKMQYENLHKEERDLVRRLKKTSDNAFQEACDLRGCQIDGLVSVLSDFVIKMNPSSSAKSDRIRPLLKTLDNITVKMEAIVNTDFEDNAQCYIFPDVQAWHKKFGFLEKLPTPFLRSSEKHISRKAKKGRSVPMELALKALSSVGPTIPSHKPWVYQLGHTRSNGGDTTNNSRC